MLGASRDGFPKVHADITATAFVVPPDEGLTGGATPAGPASTTTAASTTPPADGAPLDRTGYGRTDHRRLAMTFLRNIGADLVEKRLWPVAVALLVALVAIPALLGSSAKEPAEDGVSPALAAAAAKSQPAVTLNTDGRRPACSRRLVQEPLQAALRREGRHRHRRDRPDRHRHDRHGASDNNPSGDTSTAARRLRREQAQVPAEDEQHGLPRHAPVRRAGRAGDDRGHPAPDSAAVDRGSVLRVPRRQGGRQDARLPRQLRRYGRGRRQVQPV